MSPQDPVLHVEFDIFRKDIERRLEGHDGLYSDVSELREVLAGFSQAMKDATEKIRGALAADDQHEKDCKECRKEIDSQIADLNKFRWKALGVIAAVVAVPGLGSFALLIVDRLSQQPTP